MEDHHIKDPTNEWLLALGGPLSWVFIFIFASIASRGPDGGWSGMAVMWTGMAITIVIHIIAPIILTCIAIARRKKKEAVGKVITFGISYYGLVAAVCIIMAGPKEFLNDVTALLKVLS